MKKPFILTFVIFLAIGLCFYWFQFRPVNARKICMSDAKTAENSVYQYSSEKGIDTELKIVRFFYEGCMLSRFGVNP